MTRSLGCGAGRWERSGGRFGGGEWRDIQLGQLPSIRPCASVRSMTGVTGCP